MLSNDDLGEMEWLWKTFMIQQQDSIYRKKDTGIDLMGLFFFFRGDLEVVFAKSFGFDNNP